MPIDTAPIIVNEITLVGSRCGRFEAALPLLEHSLVPVEQMISDRFELRDAFAAFERAAERLATLQNCETASAGLDVGEKANLFERVFDRSVVLRAVPAGLAEEVHQKDLEILSAEALWN